MDDKHFPPRAARHEKRDETTYERGMKELGRPFRALTGVAFEAPRALPIGCG